MPASRLQQFRAQQPLWVQAAALLSLLSVLAALWLSLQSLWSAQQLQVRINRAWALESAQRQLLPILETGTDAALETALQGLLQGADLGFRYLAVLDADGQALIARGRYESINRSRWLSAPARSRLRLALYNSFGETGRISLNDGERRLGSLEYAIGANTAHLVRDEAVERLYRLGFYGAVLALLFGGASLLLLRALWPPAATLSRRLTAAPTGGADKPAPPPLAALAMPGEEAYDQMQIGMLLVDAEQRVRAINATASRLTGWSASDAIGQLIYTVFHLRDAQGQPLASPAERCLREHSGQASQQLRLRPRGGSLSEQHVEASACPLPLADGGQGALMLFRDISAVVAERRRQEQRAALAEGIVDHLAESVLTTDLQGVIQSANARALRLFGYTEEEMSRMTVPRLLPVPFMNTPGLKLTDYVAAGSGRMPKLAGWRKDATTFPAELLVEVMPGDDQERLVVVVRDISERLRSQGLAQRLGRLLDAAGEEIYVFDAQSLYFIEVNKGARRNLGLKPEQLARMSLSSIATDLDPAALQGYLSKLRGGDSDHVSYKTRHRRQDGSSYPVEVRLSFSREEEPPVFMAIALDITEREAAEKQMRQLAHFDSLTGLPNRTLLVDRLQQAMRVAARGDRQLGLFFLGLDDFKAINERHGHAVGDQILRAVADRLGSGLRVADTVSRLGGDEFVVLAQGVRDTDEALLLAEKIQEQLRVPMEVRGQRFPLSASIGISLSPLDPADAEGLLRHADLAMIQARRQGPGQVRLHPLDHPETPDGEQPPDLSRDIHAALEAGEIQLRLLPVFGVDDSVVAAEADFCWQHPRHGDIGSEETLRAARRLGLNSVIESWLLREVLRLQSPNQAQALPALPILLPLTARQWRDPEFAERLRELLEQFRVPPSQLIPLIEGEDWPDAVDSLPMLWSRLLRQGLRLAVRRPALDAVLESVALLVLPAEAAAGGSQDEASLERIRRYASAGRPLLLEGLGAGQSRQRFQQAGVSYFCSPALQAPLSAVQFMARYGGRPLKPL
ncbi:sensor domain-containing diguanylate cyclase [Stagnimonas aquatica]|uniref:Sensor domain-containing diguanylate cyclase n=1 Tax=Stagnimonas aquatica TaxID=2689987 RepID=A0A3N0VJW8_9GAMM|nr:diguanylate cyclase [Stagnimonas aquatica]ROH92980.1 sensor domain-containing diguanylate cyclase [Stagnimonas aquatica]